MSVLYKKCSVWIRHGNLWCSILSSMAGYADSPGKPSEEGLTLDGLAAFKWIKQHSRDASIFIWGHSMGSAYVLGVLIIIIPLC